MVETAGVLEESRDFFIHELFFSTTDKKGIIRTANEVFVRVSAFDSSELINKPHNIIRHPDMPRAVFRLLWDEITAGRQIVAYVKNRAKDHRYYWVMALITPIEGGYLSVRFKPSSELLRVVEGLYRKLRATEVSIEMAGTGKAAAINASIELLNSELQALGFRDYRSFMFEALRREMQARDLALKNKGHSGGRALGERDYSLQRSSKDGLVGIVGSCYAAMDALNVLFEGLESYTKLNDSIKSTCDFVTSLSESIRRLSLNGAIETERLGRTKSGLGKVLECLQALSVDTTKGCNQLAEPLTQLISEIKSVVFELSVAKLQIEMTTNFAEELLQKSGRDFDARMAATAMNHLYSSLRETVLRAMMTLSTVTGKLLVLNEAQHGLSTSIRSLRLIYLKGKLELAIDGSKRLSVTFQDMNRHLTETERKLATLRSLIRQLERELFKGAANRERIEQAVSEIDPNARELGRSLFEIAPTGPVITLASA